MYERWFKVFYKRFDKHTLRLAPPLQFLRFFVGYAHPKLVEHDMPFAALAQVSNNLLKPVFKPLG
jgi:hypothetical protein